VLWNFPRSLQEFHRPDGTLLDLAAADVLRTRERGVPRYCEFRRLFRLAPPSSFEELTGGDLAAAAAIERVYGGDIERVDLMIGLLAEPKPAGFAFSDTAFRIFLLMASRRLQSDRFFTADYTPRVYTPEGLAWIERTSLADVLRRHYPQLEPALRRVTNAFAPWSPRS
jgi:Animal haem peroxidase